MTNELSTDYQQFIHTERIPNRYESNENQIAWYTPVEWINLVRSAFGCGIELDPASSAEANQVVCADRYYTIEQNGLTQTWEAETLFCNPPYTKGMIMQFAVKLTESYHSGSVKQAIFLVPADTGTRWGEHCMRNCDAVAFSTRRIRFYSEDGRKQGGHVGSAFYYFGKRTQSFIKHFSKRAVVFQRCEVKPEVETLNLFKE